MKEKKDCKECGVPLKDWQVKQGSDLCLECYKSKRKTSHELLHNKSIEEEGEVEEKNNKKKKETRDEMEEEVEENLGEVNEHSGDEEQSNKEE